jgi:hypothetical protein
MAQNSKAKLGHKEKEISQKIVSILTHSHTSVKECKGGER